ncbi:MAG: MvdC/MvdD family ATP grasp protein, partial [Pseudonocardiaceae bacterium]
MTVLVLAVETDRTADSVITGLTERNVPVMRVDTSWFPQNMSLDAEFRDGRCSGVLRTAHHEVDLCDVRSVVVGNEVFAVAIHAGSEAARVDWRSDYPALS